MKLPANVASDIRMSVTGEPILSASGDFEVVLGPESIIQGVFFRLQTVAGDFVIMPECGASLEQTIGLPNSQDTGQLIEALALRALLHDGFLDANDLNVETFPISPDTVMLIVTVSIDGEVATLAVSLNLREGLINLIEQ